jgi:hypothetical protein
MNRKVFWGNVMLNEQVFVVDFQKNVETSRFHKVHDGNVDTKPTIRNVQMFVTSTEGHGQQRPEKSSTSG